MATREKLNEEHHVHLYGCLTPEDLWDIGKSGSIDQDRMESIYAEEYQKAYGIRPDWHSYWDASGGLENLRRDYLFTKKAPFPQFQASFNLIIGLCKVKPDDNTVVRKVFTRMREEGIVYAEARTVLPPYIQGDDVNTYLSTIAKETLRLEKESNGSFIPRLAISLPRENEFTPLVYKTFRSWLDEHRDLAPAFSAIDLSFYEENDPPSGKKEFIQSVREDNDTRENKLGILYHVGESFNTLSAASSARWVWETAQMGVTRLGHCLSLGIDPNELEGRKVEEKVSDRREHLDWLDKNKGWLKESGYIVNDTALKRDIESLSANEDERVSIVYDDEYRQDFHSLQDAIMTHLKATANPVIECCPSSNERIGMLDDLSVHPVKRFADNNFKICVSTDDPGIFDITLSSEEALLTEKIGISNEQMEKILQDQSSCRTSELLATE